MRVALIGLCVCLASGVVARAAEPIIPGVDCRFVKGSQQEVDWTAWQACIKTAARRLEPSRATPDNIAVAAITECEDAEAQWAADLILCGTPSTDQDAGFRRTMHDEAVTAVIEQRAANAAKRY